MDRWTGGSGYLIGGRLVLTAAHNVDNRQDLGDDEQLLVRTIEGSELAAQVVLVCDEPSGVDLALLEIIELRFGEHLPPVSFRARRPGQPGAGGGLLGGRVSAVRRSGPACPRAVAGRPGMFAATSCQAGSCERGCFPCR